MGKNPYINQNLATFSNSRQIFSELLLYLLQNIYLNFQNFRNLLLKTVYKKSRKNNDIFTLIKSFSLCFHCTCMFIGKKYFLPK